MDRRFIWAMALMTLIVMAPALLLKKPAVPPGAPADSVAATVDSARPPAPDVAGQVGLPSGVAAAAAPTPAAPTPAAPEDTVLVHTPLYTYGISTRGGRLVRAVLEQYKSQAPAEKGEPVQLMLPGSEVLGLRLVVGADTLRLDDWIFTTPVTEISIDGPRTVEFTSTQSGVTVKLAYTFRPDAYQIGVEGSISGVGPNGGLLLVGMGPGLANTEANLLENERAMGYVTKAQRTQFKGFQRLDTASVVTVSGPFEWVAVKSKYFVTSLFAFEEGAAPIGGLTVRPLPQPGVRGVRDGHPRTGPAPGRDRGPELHRLPWRAPHPRTEGPGFDGRRHRREHDLLALPRGAGHPRNLWPAGRKTHDIS